jgi:putative membrane protein
VSRSLVLTIVLLAAAAPYLRCWRALVRRRSSRVSAGHLAAFLIALLAIWAAVASPLAEADATALTGHMVQHLLLMTVAAPLLIRAEPFWVLGGRFRRWLALRFLRRRSALGGWWWQLGPVLCWLAGTGVVLFWHVPRMFEVGMRWHGLQQASFLAAGVLFWVPVIRPWPARFSWPRWAIPAYLLLATFPCDALSAFLTFCGRVVYPHYCGTQFQSTAMALADQGSAGALMWFWVTIAYLVPAGAVTLELLSPRRGRLAPVPRPRSRVILQGPLVKANGTEPSTKSLPWRVSGTSESMPK